MVGIPVIDTGRIDAGTGALPHGSRRMTVDEFYAFADTRPDGEKWELIEGEPVLNATPSRLHQRIALNVAVALVNRQRESNASWEALYDFGVRISDKSRPEPDVLVYPRDRRQSDTRRDCDDPLVIFEVLSPSTEKRDLGWKLKAYASIASLTHYVVISQDAVHAVVFARDGGFEGREFRSLQDVIDLRPLGMSLPLVEIYRDTGLTA